MQTIKIPSSDVIQAPPIGQPPLPGQQVNPGETNPGIGSKPPKMAIPGAVSENEAFKTVEQTKITTLTPMSGDPLSGQPMGNSVPLGGLIDGLLAVELMDALLPAVLVALMAAIGAQMKKTDLQLTAKEKQTLTPLTQKCMDALMINFQNPFAAWGVAVLVIYGAKLTEHGVVQIIDKKAAKAAADREFKETTKKAPTPAPVINSGQQQTTPVVTMSAPSPNAKFNPAFNAKKPISLNWNPTDEQVYEGQRRIKQSRADIIKRLQREHAAGTLEQFFKRKPFK